MTDASLSMAAIPYPCCKAGTAVWLSSAIALAQYSLKESIISTIGGTAFSCEISFFVLLGIHSTSLDDVQANVNDITVVHQVACSAGVGSADEEVCGCEGLETFGRKPGGGRSLPIRLAIFDCGMPVLCDGLVKHVEKDSVWLLHADWIVCFTNCF